nr:uncharacterized protein K02A2.6-like [Aotus nancymaae]
MDGSAKYIGAKRHWKAVAYNPSLNLTLEHSGLNGSSQLAELYAVWLCLEKEYGGQCHIFTDSWAVYMGLLTWIAQWEYDGWKIRDKSLWGAEIWQNIWIVLQCTNVSVFHVDAHTSLDSVEKLYNKKADNLTKINSNIHAEDHLKCAQWIHEHTGHTGAKTMYRWANQRGIYLPLDICKTITYQCPVCNKERLQQVPRIVTGELAWGKESAQIWQIDYIGPLPMSKGCAYICTIVDTYSGVLIGCPYKRATQLNTLKTLDYIILYYGTPLQIQSDNGSHFKGKLITDYCAKHNIEWIYHIPYYPQAAGLIERMNGLLKEKL